MIASFDGDSAGTVVRVRVTRRVMEGDLERFARSMEMGSAFASLGFYIIMSKEVRYQGDGMRGELEATKNEERGD